MSEKFLIKEAREREKIFRELNRYLEMIYKTVKELDKNAEVYLFGSVAEGKHLLSSDIDILVVTDNIAPEIIILKLWEKGIKDPFEIHVVKKNMLSLYEQRSKLIKIEGYIEQN